MRRTAVVIASVLALACAGPASAQPNLLFVLTDDQRADALAVMPKTEAAFPVDFPHFVVTTANCCRSRSSYLTGRYVHSTGVHVTTRRGYEAFGPLEPESLGPWLQARGYYTGFVGKYFNQYLRTDPVPPGWDEFYGRLYGTDQGNGTTSFTLREFRAHSSERAPLDAVVTYPNDEHPSPYSTRVFGAKAEGIIRRALAAGRPFALFLWTIGVNTSQPEEVYADEPLPEWVLAPSFLEPDLADKPAIIRNSSRRTRDVDAISALRANQLRQALTIDDVVGELTGTLRELGLRGNTVGIFASDNGRLWGEHQLSGKVLAYDESVRVPFRMMMPGVRNPTVVEAQTANIDVAPTLLELTGQPGTGFHGRSLVPLLDGSAAAWRTRVLLESYSSPRFCGYRETGWKYVQFANGEEELYNLSRDPYELDNVAGRSSGVVADFRARLRRSACRPPGLRPWGGCSLTGTRRHDRLLGSPSPNLVCAGRGNDRIRVHGGGRDIVRCGRGFDRVTTDAIDTVDASCERVLRG